MNRHFISTVHHKSK